MQFYQFSQNKSCKTYLETTATWWKKLATDFPSLGELLTENYGGFIHDCSMFIIRATVLSMPYSTEQLMTKVFVQ
jgi:hypothetical protein